MTKTNILTNTTLIALVGELGEEKALALLQSKIAHDAKQKVYHTRYNKTRAAITREITAVAKQRGVSVNELLAQQLRSEVA
jgi:hypothetical protein